MFLGACGDGSQTLTLGETTNREDHIIYVNAAAPDSRLDEDETILEWNSVSIVELDMTTVERAACDANVYLLDGFEIAGEASAGELTIVDIGSSGAMVTVDDCDFGEVRGR